MATPLSGQLATASVTANVGLYPIAQGTLGNPDYSIAYTTADLSITPRPITVEANSVRIFVGQVPPITYRIASGNLVNGDTFSGQLDYSGATGVGIWPILLGTLSAGSNYDLTYIGGSVTIVDQSEPADIVPPAAFPSAVTAKSIIATGSADGILLTAKGPACSAFGDRPESRSIRCCRFNCENFSPLQVRRIKRSR